MDMGERQETVRTEHVITDCKKRVVKRRRVSQREGKGKENVQEKDTKKQAVLRGVGQEK